MSDDPAETLLELTCMRPPATRGIQSYSAREVFTPRAQWILLSVNTYLEELPSHLDAQGREIRCHELARAVGRLMGLEVVDGNCGGADHSWLRVDQATILDPYVPARLPMAQLVDDGAWLLSREFYHPGPLRTGIREDVVDMIVDRWSAAATVAESRCLIAGPARSD